MKHTKAVLEVYRSNLQNHHDEETITTILELIETGAIDPPKEALNQGDRNREGERYAYIDTRLLLAPWAVISQQEIRAACQAKLSGGDWAVYLYILSCISGRSSPKALMKGTEIGMSQLMQGTQLSRQTIYRACEKLRKVGLLKRSNRTARNSHWLVCNPMSDDNHEAADPEELDTANRERELKNQVNHHNQLIRAVNKSGNTPVKKPNSVTLKSGLCNTFDTTTSNGSIDPLIYNGGIESRKGQFTVNEEYELLKPYLEQHLNESIAYLNGSNAADDAMSHAELTKDRDEAYRASNIDLLTHLDYKISRLQNRSRDTLLYSWATHPFRIADDLLNRRQHKTCLLRRWGWNGTQSTKKMGKYIQKFVAEKEHLLH